MKYLKKEGDFFTPPPSKIGKVKGLPAWGLFTPMKRLSLLMVHFFLIEELQKFLEEEKDGRDLEDKN